jgi:hypothetical protein
MYHYRWECKIGYEGRCNYICVKFPAGERDLSLFHSFQTGYGATQHPFQLIPGVRSPGLSDRGVKLSTHPHLAPRSRMVELYLHSDIGLHGMVLCLDTKTTSSFIDSVSRNRQQYYQDSYNILTAVKQLGILQDGHDRNKFVRLVFIERATGLYTRNYRGFKTSREVYRLVHSTFKTRNIYSCHLFDSSCLL